MEPTNTPSNIEVKHFAALGDQQYPSFEMRHILSFLASCGEVEWCEQLKNQLQLPHFLEEPFIPSHVALEMLNQTVNNHFEIGLGVDIAEQYTINDFEPLGSALKHCATLLEALELTFKYYELIGSFTDLTLIDEGDTYTTRLVNVSGLSDKLIHFIFELTLSGMISIGKALSKSTIITRTLRFRLPLTEEQKSFFESRFHCQVESGCNFNEWVLDRQSLNSTIAIPTRDPKSFSDNITQLNTLMRSLKDEFALVDQFNRLAQAKDEEFPNAKEMASALCMSERTFRRKLNKINLNYNFLMGKIRCQIAIAMLQQGQYTNEDIAFELNFSDAANFCNAFKKWTGHTPNFYRP